MWERKVYLFFDTETTGLSSKKDHVVQLAWVLTDKLGSVIAEECYVIRPDGYAIPEAAANIHGITTATACEIGDPLKDVLRHFSTDAAQATIVVAHNLSFDMGILKHDYQIAKLAFPLHGKTQICTMKLSTAWCRLPKLNNSPGFKWPKLEELHERLFGEGFDGAHDALEDTHACRRCYLELERLGVITPASPTPSKRTVTRQTVSWTCPKCAAKSVHQTNSSPIVCPYCNAMVSREPPPPNITNQTEKTLPNYNAPLKKPVEIEEPEDKELNIKKLADKKTNITKPVDKELDIEELMDGLHTAVQSLKLQNVIDAWKKLVRHWASGYEIDRSSDAILEVKDSDAFQRDLDLFIIKHSIIDEEKLDHAVGSALSELIKVSNSYNLYLLLLWAYFIFSAKKSSKEISYQILRNATNNNEMLWGGIACFIMGDQNKAKTVFDTYLPKYNEPPSPYFYRNEVCVISIAARVAIEKSSACNNLSYLSDLIKKYIAPSWLKLSSSSLGVSLGVISWILKDIAAENNKTIDWEIYMRQLDALINPMQDENIENEAEAFITTAQIKAEEEAKEKEAQRRARLLAEEEAKAQLEAKRKAEEEARARALSYARAQKYAEAKAAAEAAERAANVEKQKLEAELLKRWIINLRTKILRNNLTGIEYPPDQYERVRSTRENGYRIFFPIVTLVDLGDVKAVSNETYDRLVVKSQEPIKEKTWTYNSKTKMLKNKKNKESYSQSEYEYQRTGFEIIQGKKIVSYSDIEFIIKDTRANAT